MPPLIKRLLALLATSRAANLPTVATHVLVGFLLAVSSIAGNESSCHVILFATTAILLGSLFYAGGCLLGDVVDARFDSHHRPERPIPQGILSVRSIAVTGSVFILTAWLLSCLTPLAIVIVIFDVPISEVIPTLRSDPQFIQVAFPWPHLAISTILAVAIVAYAKYHKALGALAPALMALCRALLVIWAASPVISIGSILFDFESVPEVLIFAAATFLYTISLSLVARHESNPNAKLPGLPLKILLVLPPILLSACVVIQGLANSGYGEFHHARLNEALILTIASLLFFAWSIYALTRLKHSIPAFVSAALAGFCLMDACFAALIGWPVALACLLLFLLALLLQRIAPAT